MRPCPPILAIDTAAVGGTPNYDLLRDCGSLANVEIEQALLERSADVSNETALQSTGQQAVAATAESRRGSKEAVTESRSVRVDARKLDHLITLVGELII